MFRHLRALLNTREPLPLHVHYHLDDYGREVFCDELRCRPAPPAQPLPFLLPR
jgi:hypothetical protein